MALIEWKDSFGLGMPDIDHEHRQLIDLINALHAELDDDAGDDQVAEALTDIFGSISAHFALEETHMRQSGYDQYASHKAEHETLLDDIREIMDVQARGGYANYEAVLSEHLSEWFVEHFRTADARLHRMME